MYKIEADYFSNGGERGSLHTSVSSLKNDFRGGCIDGVRYVKCPLSMSPIIVGTTKFSVSDAKDCVTAAAIARVEMGKWPRSILDTFTLDKPSTAQSRTLCILSRLIRSVLPSRFVTNKEWFNHKSFSTLTEAITANGFCLNRGSWWCFPYVDRG